MPILGISGYYHDAAAALVQDGRIVAAAEEERFSRKKHDASFPRGAIKFCLDYSGLSLNELDAIVFYDKPFLKFERLLETYFDNVPKGLSSFVTAMPVWIKEKIFLRKTFLEELKQVDASFRPKSEILFTEHHLAHAASAFYPSPFAEAAILTIDGVGEWATASICHGVGKDITVLKELHYPDSLGLLYSSFTYFLGFKVNSGEYKLMGLAPYGNKSDAQTTEFIRSIENKLINVFSDGSIQLNKEYFKYSTSLKMIHERKWQELFGFPVRKPGSELTRSHCNLALAIQIVTERIVLLMVEHAKQLTQSENLCLAGGVALNSVANGKLQQGKLFNQIFIQPAAGDSGGAVGAALAAEHIYFNKERIMISTGADLMQNALLGPEFSNLDIEAAARKYQAHFTSYDSAENLNNVIATALFEGKVVGLFRDRMEFGPRALGSRSILASPLLDDMQQTLNLKIKFREGFRPFAAIVCEEHVHTYFDCDSPSPYMLRVHQVKKEWLLTLPENYEQYSMDEKLRLKKSVFPAITHVDFSCRIQTVKKENQHPLWHLLKCFESLSGYPILINTSFNVRGQPIVCTPAQAYECFMHTGMDVLVMNNYLFRKSDQPAYKEDETNRKYLAQD